jgi:protein gp37
MAENSGIEWTHHTFNPWIGCTKVSAACDHCYAEAFDKRFGGERWGPKAMRTRTSAANWRKPPQWNKQAEAQGIRFRVFCASLADVFDNHKSIEPAWRDALFSMIEGTPNLDWLLLTKRPQNICKWEGYNGDWPSNVWLGTTAENQEEFDRRVPHLIQHNAKVRFLSMEPLLGPVNMSEHIEDLQWVITGGESGTAYRPADHDWFRSLRDQCAAHNVPFLFKQFEGRNQREIKALGRALDGVVHDGYPNHQ